MSPHQSPSSANSFTLQSMRFVRVFCFLLALVPVSAFAQVPSAGSAGAEQDGKHSGAPLAQFNAGPIVVTPTFRIGTLAVDTNVQYQRQRKADFVASAGPGLDIALPFLDHWKLDILGSSEYYYFHRTKELRRWTGGGTSSLFWRGTGTRVALTGRLNRDFSRPSFEVDTRIASRQSLATLSLERDLGKLTLQALTSFSGMQVEDGQSFRGQDLVSALTTRRYHGTFELRFGLTPLTSLLSEVTYEETHFPNAAIRNFAQQNVGLGILTNGLVKGRATAGLRRTALLNGHVSKSRPYFRADLHQQLGKRLRLAERYANESTVSAFATDGELPTFERRSIDVDLTIQLSSRIDMKIGGGQDKIQSDGLVRVVTDNGSIVRARRDDVAYIGRSDVGMRLGRARLSVFVTYTTRQSQFFQDFGIDGLQAGARVEYSPGR